MRPSRVIDVVSRAAAQPRLDRGYHGQSEPTCQGAGAERQLAPIEHGRKIHPSSMALAGGQDSVLIFVRAGRTRRGRKMKLDRCTRDPVRGLLLYPSQGFSQQEVGTPVASGGGNLEQPTNSGVRASSSQSVARIRVIGTPGIQPTPGLGIECTPVEQSIVGVIIGPTNLCDR